MKIIQIVIAVLGLAVVAGCETRNDRGRGGTYGYGTYERGTVYGPYENGRYSNDGWYDRQGYWHENRHYRR